jgi:hypothetical protein
MFRVSMCLLGLVGLCALAGPVAAQPSAKQIYKQTLQSTCWVIRPGASGRPAGSGTGWLVNHHRRQVITNYHVVGNIDRVVVHFPAFTGGEPTVDRDYYLTKAPRIGGRVVGKDPKRDLALIELDTLPADLYRLKLASRGLSPGDRIHTIGNPGASGALWVYTAGTVRTKAYPGRFPLTSNGGKTIEQLVNAQVFDAQLPINPGDSGGPVVNDKGELVGVNCCYKPDTREISTCIDVSEIRAFLNYGAERPVAARVPASQVPASQADNLRDQGTALLRQGDYQAAVRQLTRAIEFDRNDYLAYNERGAAYSWLERDAEAIKDFTRAIELNDSAYVAYRNRGAAQLRLGNPQEAVHDFTRAIAIHNGYARAYRGRGDAYASMGKKREAEADYKKARELDQAAR